MKRSIIACVFLFFITFGIYGLYWMGKLHGEVNRRAGRKKYISGKKVVLLTVCTLGLYGLFWAYKAGELVDIIKTKKGYWSQNTATQYLIIALFGFQIFNLCGVQEVINRYEFDEDE